MIASVGPGLPLDLFVATERYHGPLDWDADAETPAADRWLESKFPLWAKSILEAWAAGVYGDIDTVIFSRADDAAQRLYYYICELQRSGAIAGPEALLLDIAKVPRGSSRDRTIAEVRELASRLQVDDDALEAAIRAGNEARRIQPVFPDAPVCLLVGTPPPDRRLHEVILAAGFAASGETLAEVWTDPGPIVREDSGDPAAAIGLQLHERPDDQRGFEDHASVVAERASRPGVRAAILWYVEEDEVRVWTVPAVRRALAERDIPALVLTRRDWAARDGVIDEIRTFLGELPA